MIFSWSLIVAVYCCSSFPRHCIAGWFFVRTCFYDSLNRNALPVPCFNRFTCPVCHISIYIMSKSSVDMWRFWFSLRHSIKSKARSVKMLIWALTSCSNRGWKCENVDFSCDMQSKLRFEVWKLWFQFRHFVKVWGVFRLTMLILAKTFVQNLVLMWKSWL